MKTAKQTLLLTLLIVASITAACKVENTDSEKSTDLDPVFASVTEIQELFASDALSSEALVKQCLERISAYDHKGPALNAMISINPNALEMARSLDAERKEKGARGPLHGIPIILKDNYDTRDLVTTGGSAILKESQPVDDAYVVKKLRDAGVVILGKANLSEFALSYGWLGYSSAKGQTKNPHNLLRDPSGSSSGSAAAIAAGYTILGTGTCTAGSIQGPSAVCGVVGIKPTMGLLSRDGIIPASLTFDVPGPITRTVSDAAIMLDIMKGMDAADPVTKRSKDRSFDFQGALRKDALQNARIGIVINFSGANTDADSVFTIAIQTLKDEGAELVEIKLPDPLDNLWPVMGPVVDGDFGPQIESYLADLPEGAPKKLEDLISIAESDRIMNSPTPLNPARIQGFKDAAASGGYESASRMKSIEEDIPAITGQLVGLMDKEGLDAIIFPTLPCPASVIHNKKDPSYICDIDDPYRTCYIASTTGFPEITVPAGYTSDDMPVGLSFVGRAFSEEDLIGFAYDFEQATHAYRIPISTPKLTQDEKK